MADFEQALKKLIIDTDFRNAVVEDWEKLPQEFDGLNDDELTLLMNVWNATAVDNDFGEIQHCHCCCATLPE